MYSEMYRAEFSEIEIKQALVFYRVWCEKNNVTPEITMYEEVDPKTSLNRILYYAEKELESLQDELRSLLEENIVEQDFRERQKIGDRIKEILKQPVFFDI